MSISGLPVRIIFSDHALQRMFQRQISVQAIREVLEKGEVLEEYPEDNPFPSRLMLGWHLSRCFHIVATDAPELGATIVITAYEPDPGQWEPPEFRQRRRNP